MCINICNLARRSQSKGNQSLPGYSHGRWTLLSSGVIVVSLYFFMSTFFFTSFMEKHALSNLNELCFVQFTFQT